MGSILAKISRRVQRTLQGDSIISFSKSNSSFRESEEKVTSARIAAGNNDRSATRIADVRPDYVFTNNITHWDDPSGARSSFPFNTPCA